ncbi:ATP12 family protein [Sphingomonas sp. HITSZ_GF]|uniref:ATP12 family chaperone protein n=1 Tax=Sphingomonas sp. HITSZ_GF TaxID=3037247 RepID=UPI00240E1C8F|nr:ATP12 family protein [Sphingomonas sp. HITSZ_GF]MDG2535039.1 ATP12 family protein [Sphingomonas sp. HITSZ_GF]
MKRFWKDVSVENGQVALDGKPVRTPDRAALALPTPALAEAVADEWRAVGETIDPRVMKLTGLANAAIDKIGPDPAPFAAGLAAYGESDLLYYRAGEPEPLVARQAESWDPLLDWARSRYDVHFETATGVIHKAQPQATTARLAEAVGALDGFHLAGLHPLVTISGSLVGALALLEGAIDAETLWQAAHVDELWQAEQWGEDELAVQARNTRRLDFDAGAKFLTLLN